MLAERRISSERYDSDEIQGLIGLLGDPGGDVRNRAAVALAKVGGSAVPALVAAREHPNGSVRDRSVLVLGMIGQHAAPAVPALIGLLTVSSVRSQAIWALGEIGDPAAIPGLVGLLADSDGEICDKAVCALGRVGSPAVPALIGLLRETDKGVRAGAVVALGKVGEPAVRSLVAALADPEWGVRYDAVCALARIGPPAATAVPALIELLSGVPDEFLRDGVIHDLHGSAIWALGEIRDPAPAPLLIEMLACQNQAMWDDAAEALKKVVAADVSVLQRALTHEDARVRRSVVQMLAEIAPETLIAGDFNPASNGNGGAAMPLPVAHAFLLLPQDRLLEFYLLASVYHEGQAGSFRAAHMLFNDEKDSFRKAFARERGWDYRIVEHLSLTHQTFDRRLKKWDEAFSHVLGRPIEVFTLHIPPQPARGPQPKPTYRFTEDGQTVLRQLEEFFRVNPPKVAEGG